MANDVTGDPMELVERARRAQEAVNALGAGSPVPEPQAERPSSIPLTQHELWVRFTYHAPDITTRVQHDAVRRLFFEFAGALNQLLPAGRSASLAFTALEEAAMQSHAAIARYGK